MAKFRLDKLTSEYIKELQADPVLAAKELLGADLPPHQRIALKGTWTHPWNFHSWGRGVGKSRFNAIFTALCAMLYPYDKSVIVGPGFRQSQTVFKELEKMQMISAVFNDSIKNIKHHSSEWVMEFKNGSTIIAVPLGTDGSKIRGLRANRLIIDEAVQVPNDIINAVVIPFMATNKDPMSKYLGIEENIDKENTLVFTTSGYYTFYPMYNTFCMFLNEQFGIKNPEYFVTQFNYMDTPDGFINMKAVEFARKNSTDSEFRTEWLGEWVSDTAGFYSATLIESCKTKSFSPELMGEKGCEYVLGVDPAEIYNSCGFSVIKLGNPYKIVHINTYDNIKYPDICSRIIEYMSNFNIVRIGLDRGAGLPVLDLFEEGRPIFNPADRSMHTTKLLPVDDTSGKEGRRIIQPIAASSQSVTEINFSMKATMEAEGIKTPAMVNGTPENVEDLEKVLEHIRNMEAEFRMVEATPTSQGYFSFKVPPHRNKDRYSAALFALAAAKSYMGEERRPALVLPTGFWAEHPRFH